MKTIKLVNLGTLSKTRGSFLPSEKLSIINDADQLGLSQTLCKHNLSASVFKRWGENFYKGVYPVFNPILRKGPEVDAVEEQIRVLKNIVTMQQIELEFKTELF